MLAYLLPSLDGVRGTVFPPPDVRHARKKKKRVSDFHRPLRLGGDAALVTKKTVHISTVLCASG